MFPTRNWIERYIELLNQDEELKLYGQKFNLVYALESESDKFVINSNNGVFKLIDDHSNVPKLTLRTSSKHWRNFTCPSIVPTYTDLFGASAHGNIEIEGNIQTIWSNIHAFWRTFELMRKVGETA